jgi:hypothetical protein
MIFKEIIVGEEIVQILPYFLANYALPICQDSFTINKKIVLFVTKSEEDKLVGAQKNAIENMS